MKVEIIVGWKLEELETKVNDFMKHKDIEFVKVTEAYCPEVRESYVTYHIFYKYETKRYPKLE